MFARPRPRVEEDAYPECIEPQENRDELWIRPQTKDHTKHCPAGDQNFVFDGVLSASQSSDGFCSPAAWIAMVGRFNIHA